MYFQLTQPLHFLSRTEVDLGCASISKGLSLPCCSDRFSVLLNNKGAVLRGAMDDGNQGTFWLLCGAIVLALLGVASWVIKSGDIVQNPFPKDKVC